MADKDIFFYVTEFVAQIQVIVAEVGWKRFLQPVLLLWLCLSVALSLFAIMEMNSVYRPRKVIKTIFASLFAGAVFVISVFWYGAFINEKIGMMPVLLIGEALIISIMKCCYREHKTPEVRVVHCYGASGTGKLSSVYIPEDDTQEKKEG